MRIFVTLLLLAISTVCCPSETDRIIFVGELKWTKLTPVDFIFRDDDVEILTSNSCGVSETEFEIHDVLLGPEISSIVVHELLGEWCKPIYPVTSLPLLISATLTDEVWIGDIWARIHLGTGERPFIAPFNNGVIFGCSAEEWPTPSPNYIPYELAELSEWHRDYLIEEGYLSVEGDDEFDDLLLNNVIYVDQIAELAQQSKCLKSSE